MLLQDKMQTNKFSPAEEAVIQFILDKQELIDSYSTTKIAEETFTSPSILIRIANKLGYNGYLDFKRAFIDEAKYLKANFQNLDANHPFTSEDSVLTVAHKIAQVKQESIKDTLLLLQNDTLEAAVQIMRNAQQVKVFTISNLTMQAEEFVFKMRHIGINAVTYSLSNTMIQEAAMTTSNDCAICISYSGESYDLLEVAEILHYNQVPIIGITSMGENSLTTLAAVTLRVATREKSYSKLGAFSSLESIALLLDILYATYFNSNYDLHYAYKIGLSQTTEYRAIKTNTIRED